MTITLRLLQDCGRLFQKNIWNSFYHEITTPGARQKPLPDVNIWT